MSPVILDDGLWSASGQLVSKGVIKRNVLIVACDLIQERCRFRVPDKVDGLGGVILLSPDGEPGWHYNTPHMALAFQTVGMEGPSVEL